MNKSAACVALALAALTVHAGTPTEWVFDASLPPGVTLKRTSPRLDESGNTLPINTPVFAPRAVSANGAHLVADIDIAQRILAVQKLDNGLTATLVKDVNNVFLTYDTPGVSLTVTEVAPHPNVAFKFGPNLIWGLPSGGEIFADGTILIITNGSAPDRRAKTILTTADTFHLESGMTLVRTSDYIPPRESGSTQSPPFFTRKTYLPNLDIVASTIAEYNASGLASTTFPGDGRSLGFGSSDNGLTWQRLIDTDDLLLGRGLVLEAKHLHHLEPFEWWDETNAQWNIGAIGCLGDGSTASGLLMAFSDNPDFNDPDQSQFPILERRKEIGLDMVTDIFPLDPSLSPGSPLRYLLGPDTSQTGVIEASIDYIDQTDRYLFRPATTFVKHNDSLNTLCSWPYIFQFDRLGNGSIVAPTMEIHGGYNPNGIWASDTTGEHWTTVFQANTTGYSGIIPVTSNRFWTFNRSGNQMKSEFWTVDAPTVQQSLLLGPAASDSATGNFFINAVDLTRTPVTGSIPPPPQLPLTTTIWHLNSTTVPIGTRFDDNVQYPVSAQPGQLISLVTWVKPAQSDVAIVGFEFFQEHKLPDDTTVNRARNNVTLHSNDWTRIISTEQVPQSGIQNVRFRFYTTENASPSMPLNYYFTQPQVIVSNQPPVHAIPSQSTIDEDRLTLALPQLGAEWSIEINLTEELAVALSLNDDSNQNLTVENQSNASTPWQGLGSFLRLYPNFSATAQFPMDSKSSDVFMPTQTRITIVMSQPNNVLKMYVNRGMGNTDGVSILTDPFTPSMLRLGTPDWSHVCQGAIHSIRLWSDEAIDLGPAPLFNPCPQDTNADNTVDVNDISFVLFRLGDSGDPQTLPGDTNDDGVVDVNDISAVLFNLGPCPTP